MKRILSILTIVGLTIGITACNNDNDTNDVTVAVTGVSLNETAFTITEGGSITLVATITPENATNRAVTWISSEPTVATVDANGVVTAILAGTTTITVTTEDGDHSATATITVDALVVDVSEISLRSRAMILHDGTITLVATVYPPNANQTLHWISSDASIATVENGVVTAVSGGLAVAAVGEVTITATSTDGTNISATTVVSVLPDRNCRRANDTDADFTLGTPYFATDRIWTIEGTGETQIWSDAVRAPGCDKTNFSGSDPGFPGPLRVDCRNAVNGFNGHYFTWCLVMRYAEQLCPYPWRVPTMEDFRTLHLNLTGTESPGTNVPLVPGTYIGTEGTAEAAVNHGGTWGGTRFAGTGMFPDGAVQATSYWSVTETAMQAGNAFRLFIDANDVNAQSGFGKLNGLSLRCVKNQ